ncbi:MAG TPA: class I SAM-dependent methyltransferase [Anaerolineales bacterium]
MPQIVASCPLCGSSKNSPFNRSTFQHLQVINRICDHCGLVFQSPRMTEEETDEFYKHEYRRINQGGQEQPLAKEIDIQVQRALALRKIVVKQVGKVSRHLEIGCSAGCLLQAIKEQYGCTSVGVEPGNAFRYHAVQQGFKVYPSLAALQENKEQCFDLISMSHVLEHMTDPVAYLIELRRSCITPDGWLFLEVPNLYGHFSFEVAHLYSFSSHSLDQVIQKAGFREIQLVKHGQPRSRMIPLYLNVLAHPATTVPQSFPVIPERNVRLKRFLLFTPLRLADKNLMRSRLKRMKARLITR